MESKYIEVLGSKMHYIESGSGKPILFLHGNPTSSYLWRNITPALAPYGHCIAVDLIGMGKSDKPDIEYRFVDHYKYILAFIEALKLKEILLVVHDWGSALGFHYFKEHPENVRGIAFMEAQIKLRYSETMGQEADFFNPLRDPETGPRMILDENFFIENCLPGGMLTKLSDEDMQIYRAPYIERESRKPLFRWVNEVPIDDKPADVTKILREYMDALNASLLPKLLLYVEGGAIIGPEDVKIFQENMKNLTAKNVGKSIHFIQEDCHEAISNELAEWYKNFIQ